MTLREFFPSVPIKFPSVFIKLVMNLEKKSVLVDGASITLTRTEFDLLHLLLANRGQVFSRQQLMDDVWQDVISLTVLSMSTSLVSARNLVPMLPTLPTDRALAITSMRKWKRMIE